MTHYMHNTTGDLCMVLELAEERQQYEQLCRISQLPNAHVHRLINCMVGEANLVTGAIFEFFEDTLEGAWAFARV